MKPNKAACILQRLREDTDFHITQFMDPQNRARAEGEVAALDLAIAALDPDGTGNLAGHTPEEWAEAIAGRIADEVCDYSEEDRALLREVLVEALADRPDLVLKLIGTQAIEEDYFDTLEEAAA